MDFKEVEMSLEREKFKSIWFLKRIAFKKVKIPCSRLRGSSSWIVSRDRKRSEKRTRVASKYWSYIRFMSITHWSYIGPTFWNDIGPILAASRWFTDANF